ncbi:amino-acid N-acetyltransferase [Marispirochaeta sp.]|jgi:amino-acid N-acetyltransferase|uniref:amino-acid N-acetyltransferase n=1 Tax=Marispirochaeta sp. TaxID=2038653 RepID=UPI0029C91005|nr:amino-acid N-acetyltransferase [Marispirochaeta sp.]
MKNNDIKEHVELIREVFSYVHRFAGATFVFKVEYEVAEHPLFPVLVKDLALLQGMGIRTVIIPGATGRINEVLQRYGIETESVGGVRISSPEAIPFIKMAAFDVSNQVMTLLAANGANAVVGNWVRARSMGVIKGIDYGSTGVVERIDTELVNKILDEGLIPILPCIGWNAVGTPYNISSNELARVAASQLQAEKLFLLLPEKRLDAGDFTFPEGITFNPEGRISRLDIHTAEEFLKLNASSSDPRLQYVKLACETCRRGVPRVHIVDGKVEGVILKEIFSNLGVGTMVHGNDYDSLRPMRVEDITDVLRIMEPFVEKEILIRRTGADLERNVGDYVVYEMDDSIHGCGALHRYSDGSGEIAGIAVDTRYDRLGIGFKVVSYLAEKARQEGLKRVFVLTTQTSDWFQRLGFVDVDLDQIPPERRERYDRQRNSRIYQRVLG